MPRQRRPSPVATTLTAPGSLLAGLRREAERLKRQEQVMQGALPQALHGHCRLARVTPQALVVVTDSPTWGNQLRFLGPALCQALAPMMGYQPERLQVRVVSPPPQAPMQKPRRLSEQAGLHLESVARSQTDPKLQAALLKLARRRSVGGQDT